MKVEFFGGNSTWFRLYDEIYLQYINQKSQTLWFPPFPFVRSTLLTCQDPQSKSHWQTRKEEETQYFAYKKEREFVFFLFYFIAI